MRPPKIFIYLFLLITHHAFSQSITWSSFQDSVGTFSSCRAVDLNNDGVQDIVIGAGIDSTYSPYGILAFDGADGTSLWTVPSNDEIYGSAVFQDITGDNIADVFIGGRNAELYAINGSTGSLIWEFWSDSSDPRDSGWYNFSSAQLVPDQNADGKADLLLANGGNHAAPPWQIERDPGHLMVIDAATGAILASAVMPDSAETYCSPIHVDLAGTGNFQIIYGTGGEHAGGSMWKTTLADVMTGDISTSIQLATATNKGFIAPASAADFNADNIKDIVIQGYNGKITVVDGVTNNEIWSYQHPNVESSAAPVIANLTGDGTPDVFAVLAKGSAPSFFDFYQIMIDGATGVVAKKDSLSDLHFASANAIDYNADGRDEILVTMNDFVGTHFNHYMSILDYQNDTVIEFWNPEAGINLASTPLVTDLDNDGSIDVTFAMRADSTNPTAVHGVYVKRIETTVPNPASGIAWGSYMGTMGDGIYTNTAVNCGTINVALTTQNISCNGADDGAIGVTATGGTSPYTYLWSNGEITTEISALAPGTYSAVVTDSAGCFETGSSGVNNPHALTWGGITNIDCIGDQDGIATVNSSGCPCMFNSCVFDWDNGDSIKTSTHLSAGWNHITITHTDGCVVEDSLLMPEPDPVIDSFMVTDLTCAEIPTGEIMIIPMDTANSTYLWSTGDSTQHIQGLEAGSYELYVSDNRPCYDTLSFFIEAPDTMMVNAVGTNLVCFGDSSGTLNVQVSGGTSGYDYQWSNGDTSSTQQGVHSGSYAVTVVDMNGCQQNDSISLQEPTQLVVSVTASDVLCHGESTGTGTVSASGGTPGYAFAWSNGISQPTMNNVPQGIYNLTVTDIEGCNVQETLTIGEPDILALSISSTSITSPCNGTALITVTGGVTPYSYQWNDGQSTATATGLCAGNYTVTVTDTNGCTITETTSIADAVTAIEDIIYHADFRVYPNPTKGDIVFDIPGIDNSSVNLYDVTGKLIFKQNPEEKDRIELSVNLPPGLYFYEISSQNRTVHKGKLIVE